MRAAFFIAVVLCAGVANADDRGGAFDILLEGGALANAPQPSASVAPIAHIVGLGRARPGAHIALTGGLSALPVPEVFALGALGRIEWLPLSEDPSLLSIFAGTRLMILQPICTTQSTTCAEATGIFGEIGFGLRTRRLSGYRIGLEVSALAGSLAPYGDDHSLHDFDYGGVAGLAVTF